MKYRWMLIIGCWAVALAWGKPALAAAGSADARAWAAWHKGNFALAAKTWEKLADAYQASGNKKGRAQAFIHMANAALELGNTRRAGEYLSSARQIGAVLNDPLLNLKILAGRAGLYFHTGELEKAQALMKTGLDQAEQLGNEKITLGLLLSYSRVLMARNRYGEAKSSCMAALALARAQGDLLSEVKASLGAAMAGQALKDGTVTAAALEALSARVHGLDNSHEKAFALISLGRLAQAAGLPGMAHSMLTAACTVAAGIRDTRAHSIGLGTLGRLYRDQGQTDDAIAVLEQAIFIGHRIDAPDLLYKWQWDLARLYRIRGNRDPAISAYREAVAHIDRIRADIAIDCKKTTQKSFRESVGPIYFELADLLLKRGGSEADRRKKHADLTEAQATIEQLKKMELQDYFQDDCVIALKARQSALDQAIPGTAVIYPVILPDRLELVVTQAGAMDSYQVNVSRKSLTSYVRALRKKIQKPGARFGRYSQKLYAWLIEPLAAQLSENSITTLVFVPDGPLRTIPMSALNDGEHYLIEKLAVATTPGLTVTDLAPFQGGKVKILLNGITEAVQGFAPLPNVDRELKQIAKLYESRVLMNQSFSIQSIQDNLKTNPFSIVHIASHGQFKKDPDNTFLLTHNGRLTLNRLESLMGLSNFRQEPVELLTLSACQTAVGDDRAALGLAGIAVKSGARCALASLWFINDNATSEMMVDFYHHLRRPNTGSKAKALQAAQLKLLKSKKYAHPAYWAPFLLIGNWL